MASRFPDDITDPFSTAELSIKSSFNSLIHKLTERRDQLLAELHEIRVDYLNKEETRNKHIRDLNQLIRQIKEANIEQNIIVTLQEKHTQKLEEERKEFQRPTPIPFPQFILSRLQELQRQMETLGALQDVATLYSTKLRPIACIGKHGRGRAELNRPRGIALDGKGNVLIADKLNSRVQVISLEGQFIAEFGKVGKGELDYPHSIALHKESVFICDSNLKSVVKYKIQNYKFVCKSVYKFNWPLGMTVDENEVFVADCNDNRIVVLSLDLRLIRELGNNKLVEPLDVQVNMNQVFVVDNSRLHNVHVFSKSGDLLNSIIGLRDRTNWVFLCFDKLTNILISDCDGKTIQIYTKEGQLVHSIECDYNPTGIAATQDSIIVCADISNDKINLY